MKRMFSCSSSQVAVESWNKQDQKLLEAVEKGDVGRVGALAARKTARPAKLNALGQSAFHLAASKGLTECLTLLLAHGAPVNEKNDDGSTALHLATIACQPQCVKVLLQHGANESHVDGQNRTPLHWAASSGCASSVLLLCDHEALLDVTDADGQTPLMLAAWGNHAAICAQLLQRGADPHLADKDKRTALALACQHGSVESAELLLRHGAAMGDEERRRYAAQTPSRALRRLLRGAHHRGRANGTGCAMDPVPQGASQGAGCPGSSSEEEEDEEQEDGCDAQRVRQLRERLARKTRECQRLVADANSIRQRVREVAQLLPSCDTGDGMGDEAGTCLALLAQHVGELRRRLAAKEEGDGGHRLTAQLSEAMGQLGGKTVAQLGGDATAQLGGKAMAQLGSEAVAQLNGDAMAQLGDKAMAQLNGKNVTQLGGNAMAHLGTEATMPALASFLTWLGDECAKLRAARASALARSRGLRKEVEEALRSKLHYEVVPAGAVRRSLAAWEKLALGLEQALGCADQTHAKILEGSRAFLGTLQQHPVTSTAPVLGRESRLELRKEAGSVEQELAELKESNKMLLGELAQLGRQRERLREELRVLREQDPGAQLVAAEGSGVAALAQALAAEREEASRLRRRLAGQRRELAALRDGVGERAREASSAPGAAGAAILRELHRKLDGLVRSQHEALQLVAEMEGDEDGDGGGGLLGKLEDGLGELGEELVPVASLREPEGARAEAERWRAVAAEEKRAKEAAEVRVAQQERELRELQEKAEGLEQSVGTLRERAGQLARACRDKEGTMKKLLAETEKLSAEVLGLRSRSTQLQLQLELQQKNHRDTVAVYRTHLLNAAQGFMDQGVHAMLLHILRSQE